MYIIDEFINELNNLALFIEYDKRFLDLHQLISKILDYIIDFQDINEFYKYMNELENYTIKIDNINKLEDLSFVILITNNIKTIVNLLNIIKYEIL